MWLSLIRHFSETAELLSDITKLASFAMTPSASCDTLKFIRLLPVDEATIVLMIVSDTVMLTILRLKWMFRIHLSL